MANGKNPSVRTRLRRSPRLAPVGDGVRVAFWKHGTERYLGRLQAVGVSVDQVKALIRNPNLKKRDERDPDDPERIRRWVRLPDGKVVRVVLLPTRPSTAEDAGSVDVVTFCVEHRKGK